MTPTPDEIMRGMLANELEFVKRNMAWRDGFRVREVVLSTARRWGFNNLAEVAEDEDAFDELLANHKEPDRDEHLKWWQTYAPEIDD